MFKNKKIENVEKSVAKLADVIGGEVGILIIRIREIEKKLKIKPKEVTTSEKIFADVENMVNQLKTKYKKSNGKSNKSTHNKGVHNK